MVAGLGKDILLVAIGTAFGFVGNVAFSRYQRRTNRADKRADAAEAFATKLDGVEDAVSYARGHPDDPNALANAEHIHGELRAALGGVKRQAPAALQFEADEATARFGEAVDGLKRGDDAASEAAIEAAHRAKRAFEIAMRRS